MLYWVSCMLPIQVPLMEMPEIKRQYMAQDLQDWAGYHNVTLQWPSTFPIRTVQPLRVTIASNNDPKLIEHLCKC